MTSIKGWADGAQFARYWETDDFDPENSPDAQMVRMLSEAKRAGRPFFLAWVEALERIDWGTARRQRLEWRQALTDPAVVEGFHAAYYDLPDRRGQSCTGLDVELLEAAPAAVDPMLFQAHRR